MKPARIVLLAVALGAGGLAAFFAVSGGSNKETIEVAAPVVERTKVLIATQTIGIGQRVSPDMLDWQVWPEDGLRPEFITNTALPDAPSQLDGVVARFEIFSGEPVREAKLVRADQGYLSAVIGQGMLGVSVTVTQESGAGGFIVPNDRVDVIVTQPTPFGDTSQTIMTNARVLAIGSRLGEKGTTGEGAGEGEVFEGDTIATLELTPQQAETVVNAQKVGELSLALRSVIDFADGPAADALGNNSTIQFIRAGQSVASRVSIPQTQEQAGPATTSSVKMPIFSSVSNNSASQSSGGNADDGQAPPLLQ
ncbi:Flp pilus assembly protein CpaB [uncultured Maritalea sp.]|jgi:pilus assembly protein CpaB|uniref:Flp pilus assembly protein CpaB n=1 Tax=uncultured Maritalea sp. TaxID=757249 RepID=UPI002626C3A8|nr:Flp pilus assembly protein CpaB [uncultured Maritalea sp.]